MKNLKVILLVLILLMAQQVFAVTNNHNGAQKQNPIYTEDKTNILVTVKSPEFSIQLKSNPTTGYSWYLREYDSNLVAPVKHQFQANNEKKLIGAPGFEVWTFKMKPAAFIVPH